MKHKYVRHSRLGIAIFPADTFLSHANISEAMRYAMYEAPSNVDEGKVISAGFVWIEKDRVIVEGKSESLGIGQAPDDAAAIRAQLGYFAGSK